MDTNIKIQVCVLDMMKAVEGEFWTHAVVNPSMKTCSIL
jgi:hypothetical protein